MNIVACCVRIAASDSARCATAQYACVRKIPRATGRGPVIMRDNNKARLTLLDDADDVLIPKRHPNHVVVRFKNKESAMAFYLWVIEHGGWDED